MLFDVGCHGCGRAAGPLCSRCESQLRTAGPVRLDTLEACRAAFWLDDISRSLIAAFKYHRQRRLARTLAAAMKPLLPLAADAITWVPTTGDRRRRRGYDQSRELAVRLGRATGVPVRALIERRQGDDRQTARSRADRLGGPDLVTSRASPPFVILVDDVMTTGSSLRVAARHLRDSGAVRIVGIVAAATPLHGR